MGISPNITDEVLLAAASVLAGASLALGYSLFLIRRAVWKSGWLLTGIEDFLYWTIAGFAVFYLLYRKNDGALRIYVIALILLTRAFVLRLLRTFSGKVLKMILKCFRIK